jgi:hypothetical protein
MFLILNSNVSIFRMVESKKPAMINIYEAMNLANLSIRRGYGVASLENY